MLHSGDALAGKLGVRGPEQEMGWPNLCFTQLPADKVSIVKGPL